MTQPPETQSPDTVEAQAVNVALDWTDYAEKQPPKAGAYEWQVPSAEVKGMTVRVLAHFRQRGAGYTDVLSPEFDHWDGYRVHVPTGTKWRPAPEETELKQYEQKLVCVEGLDFVPCPYCNRKPRLHGVRGASGGGVVITGDANRFNSWWLECCAWAQTPRYSDPRELEKVRSAVLTAKDTTISALSARLERAEEVIEPFAQAGRIIDSPFGPAIFRDDDDAFQSGCAWTENGERKTLTWGQFRAALAWKEKR